ncbi:hypothetical protein QLX08_006026 [Tetragonisca angustula]|uniref:Uncharacterized protein n=1 Tax=Tetragonisca angustula TaxID=166442 RepID=A0AAW0ZYN1_9HYME
MHQSNTFESNAVNVELVTTIDTIHGKKCVDTRANEPIHQQDKAKAVSSVSCSWCIARMRDSIKQQSTTNNRTLTMFNGFYAKYEDTRPIRAPLSPFRWRWWNDGGSVGAGIDHRHSPSIFEVESEFRTLPSVSDL